MATVIASALLVVGAPDLGHAAPVSSVCGGSPLAWTAGPWTVVERPRGMVGLRGAAVDPANAKVIYVTDGRRIARSSSGGCDWRVVLDLADRGASDFLGRLEITALVAAPARVYATIANTSPLTTGAIAPVLSSFDQGKTWQPARGLPAVRPSLLRASPADRDVMYLSMHTGQPQGATITVNSVAVGEIWSFYSSSDGGRSWTRRSAGQPRATFVPDPTEAGVVWALGSQTAAYDGPYRSDDAGATWTRTGGQPTNDVDRAELDVFRPPGRPAHVVTAQRGGDPRDASRISVHLSSDGGETFVEAPSTGLDGGIGSVAFGRNERDIVLASDKGVYRFVAAAKTWLDVDALNLAPLSDARRIGGAQASWWFWRPEFVAVYREMRPVKAKAPDTPPVRPIQVGCLPTGTFSPLQRPPLPPASLHALDDPLTLEPSVASRADFKLSLPAVPTPLDTYFLLDTSNSMQTAIDGVVCGLETLVEGLTRAGVDARFGVGEFQDAAGLRYQRVLDISPPGQELQNALRSRVLRGGEEPHRGALYQTATGAGLRDLVGRELIPPRRGATYRPEALRVVLLVTDEPFETTTTYEPSVATVVGALRSRGIHHIGIHVKSEETDGPVKDELTRRQLEEFSRGTRTFAPEGGVDCNGDGSIDVPRGAPLVCTVEREGITGNLAQTLAAVLLAVREDGVAQLRPVEASGMKVVPAAGRRVDVHSDYTGRRSLALASTVTCTDKHAGTHHTLVMAADLSGTEVTRTSFRVLCGATPSVVDPERAPPAAPVPPAVAPAPAPVTEPSLGTSVSNVTAANAEGAPGIAVQGDASGIGAVAVADEREYEVERINFTDAATTVRMVGVAGILGAFVVLERRRRSPLRALAKVRRLR